MGAICFRMVLLPHVSFPFSSGTGGPVGAGFSPPPPHFFRKNIDLLREQSLRPPPPTLSH